MIKDYCVINEKQINLYYFKKTYSVDTNKFRLYIGYMLICLITYKNEGEGTDKG